KGGAAASPPEGKTKTAQGLSRVLSHQLPFRQDVAAHGLFESLLGRFWFQVEERIQGVNLEVIAMRLSGRRSRTAVADVAKIIPALHSLLAQIRLGGKSFRQLKSIARRLGDIEKNPVYPGLFSRRIRIITDEGEALGAAGRAAPLKLR